MTSLNQLVSYENIRLMQTSSFKKSSATKLQEDDSNSINELFEYTENILFNIDGLIFELEDISDNIQFQACEHINDNDTILTANHSDQLLDFFKEASNSKTFNVIIAESAPSLKYLEYNLVVLFRPRTLRQMG
jgi:translation initiation factor 2B subunit (eIF-2B alpha/beta/delta family)